MSALPGNEPAVFTFGRYVLDRERRLLTRDGEAVSITPKAFDLLVVLVERGGAAVSKEELMAALWPDTAVEEGNLAFQVSTLRKALGPDGARCIATLPGRGYQFVAPLRRVAMEPLQEEQETPEPSRLRMWLWGAALAIGILAVIATVWLQRETTAPSPAIRSLAVLPFKPLSTQRDEALELGMADTLITRLGRMPGVVVRPISAVRQYSRLDDDPLAAGKDLDVDAVVDGSIQRQGDRMRVTVRLLRTKDGKPIWASHLDERGGDLFALQDLVADEVARAIGPATTPVRLARSTTHDLEAYDLYLKGRYVGASDARRATEFYERAVARDPRFAAAWAGIAEMWLLRGRYGSSPREKFEKARAAATKAVALDPELADAHAALAQVYVDYDWDWPRAEREYRRALELNPSSDSAHGQYAYLLFFRRDFDEALEHARRATEIDPLSPLWAVQRAWVLDCSGHYDASIRLLEETLRVHPNTVPALLHLGIAYTHAGQPEIGIARLQQGLALRPGSGQLLALVAFAHANAGRRNEAIKILNELEKRPDGALSAAPNMALAWAALGDHDKAFALLERAAEDRMFLARTVIVEPGFAELRKDARYAALVRRMGLH